MSKRERLQSIIDRRGCDYLYVEYRPNHGWYLVRDEPMHFGDDGDHLGDTFSDAQICLESEAALFPLNREVATRHLRASLVDIASRRAKHHAEAIRFGLRHMPFEELSYWSAKCDAPGKQGRNAARALRILLGAS